VEANQFSAALLIPGSAVLKEIEFNGSDSDDEEAITFLANRFRVSVVVMAHRLMSLHLLLL
jgi:Zn-dependent peptidase ImmA (M78 family)